MNVEFFKNCFYSSVEQLMTVAAQWKQLIKSIMYTYFQEFQDWFKKQVILDIIRLVIFLFYLFAIYAVFAVDHDTLEIYYHE